MSANSLTQLDKRIQNTKTGTLIAYNEIGKRDGITQRVRPINIAMLVGYGLLTLFNIFVAYDAMIYNYVQIALASIFFLVMLWAYFQDTQRTAMAIAAVCTANGIYYLIGTYYLEGVINYWHIFTGVLQILATLYYISQANAYSRTNHIAETTENRTLYDDIVATLEQQRPNNSNNLVELHATTQRITVWLRPDGVVLLLHRQRRLYFDVHRTFALSIYGTDKGGDTIPVRATLIDKITHCRISRHGWLRYTRFAT